MLLLYFNSAQAEAQVGCCRIPEDMMKMHAFYRDTGRLRIDVSNMYNTNAQAELETLRANILQSLDNLRQPSGVAIAHQPAPGRLPDAPEEDPDVRGGGQLLDELTVKKEGYALFPAVRCLSIFQALLRRETALWL
jgi:hypothetical protein